jgi:hypothetical protein
MNTTFQVDSANLLRIYKTFHTTSEQIMYLGKYLTIEKQDSAIRGHEYLFLKVS